MASQAVKDAKFGFWVAAGFLVFGIVASIVVAMSMMALGRKS